MTDQRSEEDQFWALAKHNPIEAMESPLFGLLTLAEPERWHNLPDDRLYLWISQNIWRLNDQNLRPFAIDCAERIVSRFQFDSTAPEEAISAARAYVLAGSPGRYHPAFLRMSVALDRATALKPTHPALKHGISTIVYCCTIRINTQDRAIIARAASLYAQKAIHHYEILMERDEQRWQWNRLLEYLQGQKNDR